jgi:hypothetical protein
MSQLRQNLDLPKRRLQHIQSGVERTKDPELSRRLASAEPLVRVGPSPPRSVAVAGSKSCEPLRAKVPPGTPPNPRHSDAPTRRGCSWGAAQAKPLGDSSQQEP